MNSSFGLWRWLFQRITAIILVVLLSIHIITLHFSHQAFTFKSVVARIQGNSGWLIFYGLFLLVGLWHGLNGVYQVVEDYKPSNWFKKFLMLILWLGGIALFAWGLIVLMSWWKFR
jgi:succinate dehydrogenase / fumarate reductase membrane anchor subunit